MQTGIAEIVGIFLLVVGCGAVVGAAALVSTALAVLAAGVFLILGGVLAVYIANAVAAAKTKSARTS
jgi:membrane protein implicated in regulation of membrane protease activity